MKVNDQLLLVLTASITPAPSADVSRRDPNLRRADYLQAFTYWLNHPDARLRRILFIENSGAVLTEFHEAAKRSGKDVEILSIPPNLPPPEMHYGYSELEMLDIAFSQSRLRQSTTHMMKATGRLVFPSAPRLLNKLPDTLRLAVDARAKLPFRDDEKGAISTQLFLASHEFYDATLRKGYLSLAKSRSYPHFVEHLFFELLAHRKGEAGVFLRFPVNCEPVGFAGHATKRYDSPSRRALITARAIFRVIAPGFWF